MVLVNNGEEGTPLQAYFNSRYPGMYKAARGTFLSISWPLNDTVKNLLRSTNPLQVVVHMNAHDSSGIEACFRLHCSVINYRTQQMYTTSLRA
ncbi:hypothetical protein NQZ68_012242 [Dissostichus eleginoides]|nr:hypothetical protein NQZ68_012242 [Dissostichus eleginoides]